MNWSVFLLHRHQSHFQWDYDSESFGVVGFSDEGIKK